MEKGNWNGWKTQAPIDCKPGKHCKDLERLEDCEMPCCPWCPIYVTCDLWYRGKTRTDKDGR